MAGPSTAKNMSDWVPLLGSIMQALYALAEEPADEERAPADDDAGDTAQG